MFPQSMGSLFKSNTPEPHLWSHSLHPDYTSALFTNIYVANTKHTSFKTVKNLLTEQVEDEEMFFKQSKHRTSVQIIHAPFKRGASTILCSDELGFVAHMTIPCFLCMCYCIWVPFVHRSLIQLYQL